MTLADKEEANGEMQGCWGEAHYLGDRVVPWTGSEENTECPDKPQNTSASLPLPHPELLYLQPGAHVSLSQPGGGQQTLPSKTSTGRGPAPPSLLAGEHNGHLVFSEEGFRRVTHVLA